MTSVDKQLFKFIDAYAKTHYRCFLAEMFLNKSGTAYTLCFRSMGGSKDSPNRYDCRYLNLEISEAKIAEQQNSLSTAAMKLLDEGLISL
jgi:hypothetical protein